MTVVLRSTDPRLARLEAEGWCHIGESWGARLRLGDPPDLAPFVLAVHRAEADGWIVQELGADRARELADLDGATAADYPITPATTHEPLTPRSAADLWHSGRRIFAAYRDDGVPPLAAATVVYADAAMVETDFTAVRRESRRRGLGAAVKAASILALASAGHRLFGTGGSRVNAASIRVNESLGYRIEERWLALEPPRGSPGHDRTTSGPGR